MQPLDSRDLYDYKYMYIMGCLLLLGWATFMIGPTVLTGKNDTERMYEDYLTVNAIEDKIREIRLQNKSLEDELAQLKGSDESN